METTPRLLIVDDEDIVLKSCLRIFRKENYGIVTARSGEEGLEKLAAATFDLVITDLKMPGMGGMELVKRVRTQYPKTTVIIFTGYATVETAREALKLGIFDYVPKPFTPDELRDVVHNALKARADDPGTKMLDLMAIVSHELKSPLATVQTTADTLFQGYFGKLDEKQQQIVATIIRNCQYLEDIIRSYIDLSKMEIDDLESFKREIRFVEDVVQPVLDIPEHSANMKGMPLVAHLEPVPPLMGDPNLLKIVVTNLVNNAVKYGTPGTEIRIEVRPEDGRVLFAIRNEGVGISQEDIERRLFKKFSRLKQKGTEGVKGSGLGLYICRQIIDKHQGRIGVTSEPGRWVRFFFTLPT